MDSEVAQPHFSMEKLCRLENPSRENSNKQHQSTNSYLECHEMSPGLIRNEASCQELYDHYLVPPNFHFAKLHAAARKVGRLVAPRTTGPENKYLDRGETDYQGEVCPCCNYPVNPKRFPLFMDIADLNELGEGFPLYYDLVKWLTAMMMLVLLVAGVFCLAENYQAGRIEEKDTKLEGHLILMGTLANYGNSSGPSIIQPWLHVICVWLLLACDYILRVRHKRLTKALDFSMITPSDYTVMLTNLPRELDTIELKQFLEVNGRPDKEPCKVVKINLVHRMSTYVQVKKSIEKYRQRIAVVKKMNELDLKPPYCCFHWRIHSIEHFQMLLEREEAKLRELESKKFDDFSQVAFVTFDQDEEGKSVAKFLDRPEYETIWQVIFYILCPNFTPKTTKNLFKGRNIRSKRAPEPSDICWENIGVSKATVIKRRVATWTATAIVLAAGIVVIIFSAAIRTILTDGESSTQKSSLKDEVVYNLLAFLPSSLVIFVNMALSHIIRIFSKFERHVTVTSYSTSVALKQTLAMFLNTAMTAIVVHWGDFYSAKGLAVEIYNIMISNSLVQPVAYIFNPVWVVRWICAKLETRKGDKCMLTQNEANKLLEGRRLDMPHRYATLLKTFIFTLVYAPMIPIVIVFGILALMIQYWLDKVMLLRFVARPGRLSHSLDEAMLGVIPIAAILYAIANWIFYWNFVDGSYIPGITGVVTACFYALGPWGKIGKIIRYRRFSKVANNVISLSESDKSYEEVAIDFVDDYDRANPLTTEEGHKYWLNLIRRKRGEEAAHMMEDALRREDSTNHKKLQVLRRQHKMGIVLKSFVNGQLRRRHAVEESKEATHIDDSQKCQPDVPSIFSGFLSKPGLS